MTGLCRDCLVQEAYSVLEVCLGLCEVLATYVEGLPKVELYESLREQRTGLRGLEDRSSKDGAVWPPKLLQCCLCGSLVGSDHSYEGHTRNTGWSTLRIKGGAWW